jgi:hypothetical protein
MSERTATFAGFLNPNDFTMADGMVSIDFHPPGPFPSLPPGLAEQIAAIPGAGTLKVAPLAHGVALDGTTIRSPRPYTILSASWASEDAGLGAEDVGRKFAASCLPANAADEVGLPGDALECWLLPVVSFMFDYLITPAGDWPPPEAANG